MYSLHLKEQLQFLIKFAIIPFHSLALRFLQSQRSMLNEDKFELIILVFLKFLMVT